MEPEDFFSTVTNFSKNSSVYNTLSHNYLNTGWNLSWNCDLPDQPYQDVKNNRIFLNVNYIGIKTIYIERPNCEDLINIKELNPAVIVGNDLKTLANYADSFDDIEEKGKGIAVNNIEEIEVSTGRFNSSNFQREISEEEFNLITTNEKFRNEIVESAITSISSRFLDNFERQVECLKLNPNIYHEKFVEVINNLRDYLEITITDYNDKITIINPKTYEITNLRSCKADERFIEDLLFLVADEFNFLINKDGNPAESFKIILNFLRNSNHKELAKKIDNYLSL